MNPAFYGIAYQKEPIRDMLRDFHLLTGIRVAYYPISEYPTDPMAVSADRMPAVPSVRCGPVYPEHIADFCAAIRQDPIVAARCLHCDRQAFRQAQTTDAPVLYRCHMGLLEAVAPISDKADCAAEAHNCEPPREGTGCLGYLMMGQILDHPPGKAAFDVVMQRLPKGIQTDSAWETAFYRLNHLSFEKICAAFRLLTRQAQLILTSEWAQRRSMPLLLRLETAIRTHSDMPLRTADLSSLIGLSPSRLTHVVKAQTGRTVTQFIRTIRIQLAKEMLRKTSVPIQTIARSNGWLDPRYFSRVFRQITGETPQAYRNRFIHPTPETSLPHSAQHRI